MLSPLFHPEISQIVVGESIEVTAKLSAEAICTQVEKKPDSVLTFATGNTMIPVYKQVVEYSRQHAIDWSQIVAFHLDEYYPCASTDPWSFVTYLRVNLFDHLNVPDSSIHFLDGATQDPIAEAKRYEALLSKYPVDLTILGIGPGGHIGFNEKGTPFSFTTHVQTLSQATRTRDQIERNQDSPAQAITQGIATILRSLQIITIAFGKGKGEILRQALYEPISEDCPASSLRTVGEKVKIFLDREAGNILLPERAQV